MEVLEMINYHWLIIVFTGLYVHLRGDCVIGLCFQKDIDPPFDASISSVIFLFSALCLLAEYNLWPRTLKEPPLHLLIIYEMLVSSLVTNLVIQMIWTPLMHMTWALTQESSNFLLWLNKEVGLDNSSPLVDVAYFMSTPPAASYTAIVMSSLSLLWMLDATESLEAILYDCWSK